MPVTIPSTTSSDLISMLRGAGATGAATSQFFSDQSLTGTIEATNIDYNPVQAPLLNPANYPNLNASQLTALQQNLDLRAAQVNQQQQTIINDYQGLRTDELQRNTDTLSATQQIFGVLDGVAPLQSGRNAAALTGIQAETRQNLLDFFNEGRSAINETTLAFGQDVATTLQSAVEADINKEQNNFDNAFKLSDQYGFSLDANGNLQTVGGVEGRQTLQAEQNAITNELNARKDDRSEREFIYDTAGLMYSQDGKPAYEANDGSVTFSEAEAKRVWVGDNGTVYDTLQEAEADESNPDGTVFTEQAARFLGPDYLAKQAKLKAADDDVASVMSQTFGNAGTYTEEGILNGVNLQNSINNGLNVTTLHQMDSTGDDNFGVNTITELLDDPAQYDQNYHAFDSIYFSNQETSSVAFAAGDRQTAAGYDFFTVKNPGVGGDITMPTEILEHINAKITNAEDKLPTDIGFFEFLREGKFSEFNGTNGDVLGFGLQSQDVGDIMDMMGRHAMNDDNQISKAVEAGDIINIFQTGIGDSNLKAQVLKAMISRQNASLMVAPGTVADGTLNWQDWGNIGANFEKMFDGIDRSVDTYDTLTKRKIAAGGDGTNDDGEANTVTGPDANPDGLPALTEEFYEEFILGNDSQDDSPATMNVLAELNNYKAELYENYASGMSHLVQEGAEISPAEAQQFAAGEYFVATVAMLLGGTSAPKTELARDLLGFLETPEEVEAREAALEKVTVDSQSSSGGPRLWFKAAKVAWGAWRNRNKPAE